MARAIGIDLGTTNSCAAVVEGGKPTVLTYPNGMKTIPSVFAIDKSGQRLVGDEAKVQAALNPLNTVQASKRLIGRSYDSDQVAKHSQVFTYELLEGEQSEVMIRVANQVMTLEQISAQILMRIRDNAEEVLKTEVTQAVITVPAYFNDRQRQAVRAAGRLSGLKVLRVLNEPTAAALAYGLGRKLNQRVAIYDLGGGTFDISLIDIKDRIFEVVATGGDTFLGGVDFDDRVMQHVLGEFLEEHGVDLSYDRSAITRIRDAAEQAKIALSTSDSADIEIIGIAADEGTDEPLDLRLTIDRALLETLTGDLVERSVATCARILKEAGTHRGEIDELLLVGGQSLMPLVRRRLKSFLGREPSDKVHPDEAVAIGAAIMAHSLSAKNTDASRDVTLLDVLPMPIGLNKRDGRLAVLFPKNQPLPAYKTRVLTTSKDNQRSLMLRIYQGEAELVRQCELLGTFVFQGLRRGPKGDVRLEVTFHIDSEGILNLTAIDQDTGDSVESQINIDGGPNPAASKKKKKRKPEKPPEPEAQAPSLDMPLPSSLTPGAAQTAGETASETAVDTLEREPVTAPEPEPEPEPEHNDPLRSAVRPRKGQKAKTDSKRNEVATTDSPGVVARLVAWLKGLFGKE